MTLVSEALKRQEQRIQAQLNAMNERLNNLSIEARQVQPYKRIRSIVTLHWTLRISPKILAEAALITKW